MPLSHEERTADNTAEIRGLHKKVKNLERSLLFLAGFIVKDAADQIYSVLKLLVGA